jgi:hypothetical protein
MTTTLDAASRIRLAIGTQFCELQILQDEVVALKGQIEEKDARIKALEGQLNPAEQPASNPGAPIAPTPPTA